MTGSVVNLRYGIVIINGSDSRQYYYAPDRATEDLGTDRLTIGDAVTFEVEGTTARKVEVTGRAFDPGTEGFA